MADLQISVTAALKSAGELWRRALPAAWGPLLLLAGLNFGLSPALHAPPILLPFILAFDLVALALANGALMRLALGDQHAGDAEFKPGPAGLQWTGIETRLLGAILLLMVLVGLLTIATVFLVMLVAIVVAAATGAAPRSGAPMLAGPSVMAGGIALAAAALLILWAFARLSLAMAATVDRRQVQVFSTWSMTKGRILPLFVSLAIVTLPAVVLSVSARWLQGTTPSGEPAPPLALTLWALYALVAGFTQAPLVAGVTAWFYRQAHENAVTGAAHN